MLLPLQFTRYINTSDGWITPNPFEYKYTSSSVETVHFPDTQFLFSTRRRSFALALKRAPFQICSLWLSSCITTLSPILLASFPSAIDRPSPLRWRDIALLLTAGHPAVCQFSFQPRHLPVGKRGPLAGKLISTERKKRTSLRVFKR